LTDHLGNVTTVVTGRLLDGAGGGTLKQAELVSAQGYESGGSLLPGRNYSSSSYAYGFNGMRKDDEINGATGTSYDFGARLYDPRVGRWLAIDPLASEYASSSPYGFAMGNPIFYVDHDGKEVVAFDKASQTLVLSVASYLFGSDHGFSFENNILIHGSVTPPAGMNDAQSLMYNYFVKTLVESTTVTEVHANTTQLVDLPPGARDLPSDNPKSHPQLYTVDPDGGATIRLPASASYNPSGTIAERRDAKNVILIHPLTMDGTTLGTTAGVKTFSAAHATAHEFAHAIVNTIMTEFGGEFNGVNFNIMSSTQRADWSIQFTNTLLSSQGKALEDGSGQHGRGAGEAPAAGVPPLKE